MKDSRGRPVPKTWRLFALIGVGLAIGVGEVVLGSIREGGRGVVNLVLGGVLLAAVALFCVSVGVTQWRRRYLQPDDGAATPPAPSFRLDDRTRRALWLTLALGWAALDVVAIVTSDQGRILMCSLWLVASAVQWWRVRRRSSA